MKANTNTVRLTRAGSPVASVCGVAVCATTVALVVCVFFVFGVGSASARVAHGFTSNFGEAGSGAGQMSLQAFSYSGEVKAGSGVAVDSKDGVVFVADTGNRRIDVFTTAGSFVRAFGADVGGPGVDVCVAVCSVGSGGSAAGELSRPAFLAVDEASGWVYVGEESDGWVSKFSLTGELVTSWGEGGRIDRSPTVENGKGEVEFNETPFEGLDGVATDDEGNLLVYNANGRMFRFEPTGGFISYWDSLLGAKPAGIAVHGNDVFVVYGADAVVEFTLEGKLLGFLTAQQPVGVASGLGVDSVEGGLFVDEANRISQLSPGCLPTQKILGPFCSPTEAFGAGLVSGVGVGVDAGSHIVFVGDAGVGKVEVFGVVLEGVTEPSSEIGASSAVLHGRVNPEGAPVTKCLFEYGTTEAYGHLAQCEPDAAGVGSGSAPVEVSAKVVGLADDTEFHYRLVVGNASAGVAAADEHLETLPLPQVSGVRAREVSGSSAVLCGVIDPRGVDARYRFEWGASEAYGNVLPVPDGEAGSGSGPVEVCVKATGLTAGVTYHWRFVASNANGSSGGGDHRFVYQTGGAPGLPDGRSYEMVTPVEKNGALIGTVLQGIPPLVAEDGSAVMAASIQCFAGSGSCTGARQFEGEPYEFSRSAAGWATTPLAPPVPPASADTAWAVSPLPGVALFTVPEGVGKPDDFVARRQDGSFATIGPVSPPARGALGVGLIGELEKAETADLSHVVWDSETVWPFDETHAGTSLYAYEGFGRTSPVLVGVTGGKGSTSLISECGTHLGTVLQAHDRYGSLSADGSETFFTATRCKTGSGTNAAVRVASDQLWVRVNGERSVLVSSRSSSECATPACEVSPAGDAAFQGASADGSRVIFTSTQQLTDTASEDAHTGDSAASPGCTAITQTNGCNLYMVVDPGEVAGHRILVDVSAGDSSGEGPRVQGVTALSADGTHVYFVAKGTLTTVPNATGQEPINGADNLYVYERDRAFPGGHLAFVASEPASDDQNWATGLGETDLSPDGRFFVFLSHGGLTPDSAGGEGPAQVYEYDAATSALVRVSKGQAGFNDDGNSAQADATIARPVARTFAAAGFPRLDPTMSHDGAFVFFESPAALTRGALDEVKLGVARTGRPSFAENVYEYHDGNVYLISDGRDVGQQNDVSDVELLGVDASGANAFFTSSSQLTAGDTDTSRDYYDARVCTAVEPCVEGPSPVSGACVEVETCRGVLPGPPVFFGALSEAFTGPGNFQASPSALPATKKKIAGKPRCGKAHHAVRRPRGRGFRCVKKRLKAAARAQRRRVSGGAS